MGVWSGIVGVCGVGNRRMETGTELGGRKHLKKH